MSTYPTKRGYGVDYRDTFNRRIRRFVGTEQAARSVDAELRRNANFSHQAIKAYRESETLDLITALDIYLAHRTLAPYTLERVRSSLTHAFRRLGNPMLTEVTPNLLQKYAEARKAELNQNSLAKHFNLLKTFFTWTVNFNYLPFSPATGFNFQPGKTTCARIITYPEELRIMQAAHTPYLQAKILTALDAGLRRAEVNRMRKNHLSLESGNLTVWASKNNRERQIPLTPRLQQTLQERSAHLWPDALIFSFRGNPISHGTQMIRKIRAAARTDFRFHDLRHTFASRLAASGAPHYVIRELLGHAPNGVTDRYTHATPEQKSDAILNMAEYNALHLAAAIQGGALEQNH